MQIQRLIFLIHPFCYIYHVARGSAPADWPYLPCEVQRGLRWREGVEAMGKADVLAMVPLPVPDSKETQEFTRFARAKLGKRFITLDCPDYGRPGFWKGRGATDLAEVVGDFRDACLGQGVAWNKEELETSLHARACAAELLRQIERKGMGFDPRTLRAQAWGASFEGCVRKYSLSFRRLLGLAHPIEIDFDWTVCDATFLLKARQVERVALDKGLRLFLFEEGRRPLALFMGMSHSMADRAARVRLPGSLSGSAVRDKRGLRLWPRPVFKPVCADVGWAEPQQQLVREVEGRLEVPLCMGFVYRMAKAPAFISAAKGMTMAKFRAGLVEGELKSG